ncbi:MEKHLA domain-containing protein [Glaciimonas soli]|uniref:MEKHLA domain-containing protein n=1 Tax=Glaciimonas soli TaxID=2590999 RepID=A0A843YUU0_9BURK|nr:MEKHLA domain-containing protein [Glaciimonas soli]MQR01423.1 MEKHLA domain-containing protein [Glaciimonas soli]
MTPGFAQDQIFLHILTESYRRLTGRNLMASDADAHWLYHDAPFSLLAHSAAIDPCFIYANQSAQNCFEYNWDEIIKLPSRLSAEMLDRAERQRLLDAVTQHGYIDNYSGIRIAKSGRRFWIKNATVWNLTDEKGIQHGQAALFADCENIE